MKKGVFYAELRKVLAESEMNADRVILAVEIAIRQAKLIETAGKPPRKIRRPKASNLVTLAQWEEAQGGQLSVMMIAGWITSKGLNPLALRELIEEFRIEMVSKNKEYGDFKAAFQNYLNKGYLSKRIDQVKATVGAVRTTTRGIGI